MSHFRRKLSVIVAVGPWLTSALSRERGFTFEELLPEYRPFGLVFFAVLVSGDGPTEIVVRNRFSGCQQCGPKPFFKAGISTAGQSPAGMAGAW
jgi:hypothetical protein